MSEPVQGQFGLVMALGNGAGAGFNPFRGVEHFVDHLGATFHGAV